MTWGFASSKSEGWKGGYNATDEIVEGISAMFDEYNSETLDKV